MPAKQPAKLLLLNGRKAGQDSAGRPVDTPPAFKRLAPEPPSWLSPEARSEWEHIVPGLTRLDLVKPEDRATLTMYCELWSRWVTAVRDIAENGQVVQNRSVKKDGTESVWWTKNPSVQVAEQAETRLRQFANDFGLTPAGERNVSVRDTGREHESDNPFAGAVGDD
jgi:P27 family predicted phage terminase small subunit